MELKREEAKMIMTVANGPEYEVSRKSKTFRFC